MYACSGFIGYRIIVVAAKDYNMKVIVAFLLVNFSVVHSLQLVQFGQKDKLHCSNYIDLKAAQNSPNNWVIKKCETVEFDLQFGNIMFNKCSSGSINCTLQDMYCMDIVMARHPIAVIARNKESDCCGKLYIHDFLSSLHHHHNLLSICNCHNTTHNNASIVMIFPIFYQSQNACFICCCGNTTCINASKVTNKNRNAFNKLYRDVHINKPYSKVDLKILLSKPVIQIQNTSLDCPLGFKAFHNHCNCDPKLVSALPLIRCIKSQLVRPPMTWIGCEKNCTQVLYSTNCFVDYCLLTASYIKLNVSTNDVQCNYGRTGRICGHCHEGYDSVFGSQPRCKKCSNIWLWLIPVFGVAGFFLVIVLFLLDLTVTKGLINGFVLYTNIVGMENVIIFPLHHRFLPVLVDISNLNLGIETCFD